MSIMSKKQTRMKATIEDIYCNKLFVPPKEQNLETIFEEPRQSKDGVPILTSVKKYKRYLHFDPTQNKIQKRKRKAKKCLKKLKSNNRVTRSSPENSKCDDLSMYILDALGDSSNDSDAPSSTAKNALTNAVFSTNQLSVTVEHPTCSEGNVSCVELCDTPKITHHETRSTILNQDKDIIESTGNVHENPNTSAAINTSYSNDEKLNSKNDGDETLESSRRLIRSLWDTWKLR